MMQDGVSPALCGMVGSNDFRSGGVPALLVHQNAHVKPLEEAVALQPVLPQLPRQLLLAGGLHAEAAVCDARTITFTQIHCLHVTM